MATSVPKQDPNTQKIWKKNTIIIKHNMGIFRVCPSFQDTKQHLTLSSLKTATAVERIFPFIPENL